MTTTNVIPLRDVRKHPLARCEDCPMNGHRYKFVPSDGKQDSDLIVVGEAPGVDEIVHRKPFVGPSGKLMKESLRKAGIDSTKVFYTNAVLCHPPDNKLEPYAKALDCCRPRLEAELNAIGNTATPILAVGKHGAQAVIALTQGTTAPRSLSITAQHGRTYQPSTTARVRKRVHLAVHPAYVLRVPSVYGEFMLDIQRIFAPAQEHTLHTAPGYRIVHTLTDLREDLDAIPDGSWVSMDVETNNLIWYDRPASPKERLLMIGIAASTEYVTIIPESLIRSPDLTVQKQVRGIVIEFMERVRICGHNGKFDALVLVSYGFWNARIDFDTMLAHGSIKETPPHGLKELAAYYYSVEDYEADLVTKYFKSQKKQDRQYSLVPQDHLAQYLAWDCATTLQLREDMHGEMMTQDTYEWPFRNLLMRASTAFIKVERAGVKVDVPYLGGHVKPLLENDQYLTLLGLRDMVGDSRFNPNSTQQVAHVLYDVYGFKPARSKHFPLRSTCAAALKQIGPELENHVFTKLFMQYRRIGKLLSSYVNPILSLVDVNGYVHASYRLLGAETGRLSATDPAIQTLPRAARDKYGPMIRAAFIAEHGWKLVMADYSQAEMRVWAHLCQDPFLLKCYREGRDLHSEGAIRLFGPNYTKEQRTWVKNFNFAYVYGGNEYSFAGQYNLPISEAAAFVREYEAMMPVARAWRELAFQDALRKGYVETPFGRRRRFTLITPETHDEIRKTAWNFPPQSIASDLTLLSLCVLTEENYNVVLNVHDSIGEHVVAQDAEEAGRRMREVMVATGEKYVTSVPWVVDVDIQDRWSLQLDDDYEQHEVIIESDYEEIEHG